MQVEAIYSNGHLEFPKPIKFKQDHVRLLVTVPDEQVDTTLEQYHLPPDVLELAEQMISENDEILNAPSPPDEELPPVSEKQLERMRAFAQREDR